jgi:antagonist of KipI
MINGKKIAVHQPVAVGRGTVLSFGGRQYGTRCYLALLSPLQIEPWLNSCSNNLKAEAGGYHGRRLEKGDTIQYDAATFSLEDPATSLPWQYRATGNLSSAIEIIPGPEWNWLMEDSQTRFLNGRFLITPASDRMGYRLQGEALEQSRKESLVSSAVSFGTVQLLPSGQLILLMADHQTTGGYPRMATVIRTHLPG